MYSEVLLVSYLTCLPYLIRGSIVPISGVEPNTYTYPLYDLEELKIIQLDDLHCPLPNSMIKYDRSFKTTNAYAKFVTADLRKADTREGFICQGIILYTHCRKNFWGNTVITTDFALTKPDWGDCALRVMRQDTSQKRAYSQEYPTAECSWLSETTVEKVSTNLYSQNYAADPYSGRIENPHLKGGFCVTNSTYCETNLDSEIWIMKDELEEQCLVFSDVNVQLLFETHDSKTILAVRSPDGRVYNMTSACKLEFCGYSGFKAKSGEFMYIDVTLFVEGLSPEAMDSCPLDAEITPWNAFLSSAALHVDVIQHERYLECIGTLETIRRTQKISNRQLGLFRPLNPGKDRYYCVNSSGVLLGAYATYATIDLSCSTPDCLGEVKVGSRKGEQITSLEKNCSLDTVDDVWFFNGLLRSQHHWIVPDLSFMDDLHLYKMLKSHPINEISRLHTYRLNETLHSQFRLKGEEVSYKPHSSKIISPASWFKITNPGVAKIINILFYCLYVVVICILFALIFCCIIPSCVAIKNASNKGAEAYNAVLRARERAQTREPLLT